MMKIEIKYSLAAIAISSCLVSVPALAQEGPTLEFTTNYILERCSRSSFSNNDIVYSVSISGDRINLQKTIDDNPTNSLSFDVNDVYFEDQDPQEPRGVSASCLPGVLGNENCISVAGFNSVSFTNLGCRDASNVLRALNRFQALHGGPRQPNDPFANPGGL